MTVVQVGLVAAFILVMARFYEVYLFGGKCPFCDGHGAHRDDCPRKDVE